MQKQFHKIKVIKKSDKEAQRALAIAARTQFIQDTKPFYFDKAYRR